MRAARPSNGARRGLPDAGGKRHRLQDLLRDLDVEAAAQDAAELLLEVHLVERHLAAQPLLLYDAVDDRPGLL
jgi:hypothetical protein